MKLSAIACLAMLAFTRSFTCAAETDSFEVASIRFNRSGDNNTRIDLQPGGRMVIVNATVKTLIRNAYEVLSFQLADEPNWLDKDKFDINAKIDSGGQIPPARLRLLLRNLLNDRFHLRVHQESRQSAIYVLVTDRSGPKFALYGAGQNMA